MKFREFYRIPQPLRIDENKQQYNQMMKSLVDAGFVTSAEAINIANDARKMLKRNDRVVWFLKHYKAYVVDQDPYRTSAAGDKKRELESNPNMSPQDVSNALVKWMYKVAGWDYSNVDLNSFKRNFFNTQSINHYASMFDEIADANEIIWTIDKTPEQLKSELEDSEEEWRQRREQWVTPEQYDEVILSYNNGTQGWVKLNREYCRAEGGAMGHCGNTADWRTGDTILSFRTIKDTEQKPHLTFILDANGLLGEMKGRANNKPNEKYHPYIVDLLKQPFIKGIKGGGYAPEENFELDDLDEDEKEELINMKPQLAGPVEMYKRNGRQYSEEIGQILRPIVESKMGYRAFDISTGIITAEIFDSVAEIGDTLGDNNLEHIGNFDVFGGEDTFGWHWDGQNIRGNIDNYREAIDDMVGELDDETSNKLENYLEKIGDWEVDEDTADKIVYVIRNDDDELGRAFVSAINHGSMVGAEQEMYNSVVSHLKENNLVYNKDSMEWELNVPSSVVLDHMLYEDEEIQNYSWADLVEYRRYSEPRYGYDGWDLESAVEDLKDQLYDNVFADEKE